MLILHAADLHLDRAFCEGGLRAAARRRRLALRDALHRIVEEAREADALCIAGDLYEHEHVSADTQAMLVDAFGSLQRPVFLAPGNHDPHLPGSLYARAPWTPNVHVFRSPVPEPVALSDGVVLWGVGYVGRELDPDVVRRFRAPADGRRHLLLVHASLAGVGPGASGGDAGHCAITQAELDATGADAVLLGHFHAGRVSGRACYPGSPEPLTWGERLGMHGVNRVHVSPEGVRHDLTAVNRLRFSEVEVDVAGAGSGAEVERLVFDALPPGDDGLTVRVTLVGAVAPGCELRPGELAERCGDGLAELFVVDRTAPALDLASLATEPSVRGRFVAALLERARLEPAAAERYLAAARAGLAALDGNGDPMEAARVARVA